MAQPNAEEERSLELSHQPIGELSSKGRPSDIGGDLDEEDGRSGMNWCEDIKFGETAPTSLNIYPWISGVAQAARIAYLRGPGYAHRSIVNMLRMSEAERGRPLFYPALENKLYQAIRNTVKPNTPEMNAITALELTTGERPPTALQLMHVLLDRIRVPQEDESAVYTEAILVMEYMDTPGQCEEQNLEKFLIKWDLALANLSHTSGTVFNHRTIAGIFLSKIRRVACLEATRDMWEDLNPEQKTYEWLRDRVELKLKRWRQDSNTGELYGEHMRTISSSCPCSPSGWTAPRDAYYASGTRNWGPRHHLTLGTRGFCIGASRYPEAKTGETLLAPAILCRATDEEAVSGQKGHFSPKLPVSGRDTGRQMWAKMATSPPSYQFRAEILDLGQIRANPTASRANRPRK